MTPKRIQMSRQVPWRSENPDAVIVARPTKWGNPFKVDRMYGVWEVTRDGDFIGHADSERAARSDAVARFKEYLDATPRLNLLDIDELAGHDLACWCPLDQPCHADVLLDIANGGES